MKRKLLYILGGIIGVIVILAIIGSKTEQSVVQDVKQETPIVETQKQINELETKVTNENSPNSKVLSGTETKASVPSSQYTYYQITRVVDGDTVKISMNGKEETFRLIGLDTPETVDPRKEVQCFGIEASNKAKELLTGKKVRVETDSSQGTYDKYNRMLGYIYLEDGLFYNKYMIEQGYAHEYTYGTPYKYQTEFKNTQKLAQANKAGLWSPNTCNGNTTTTAVTKTLEVTPTNNATGSCTIKGNISSTKEKIYHMIGCGSYTKTVIDESTGEKWFCSEQEAISAGWRKALNCQ